MLYETRATSHETRTAPNEPNFRVSGLKMRIELKSKAKRSQSPQAS